MGSTKPVNRHILGSVIGNNHASGELHVGKWIIQVGFLPILEFLYYEVSPNHSLCRCLSVVNQMNYRTDWRRCADFAWRDRDSDPGTLLDFHSFPGEIDRLLH